MIAWLNWPAGYRREFAGLLHRSGGASTVRVRTLRKGTAPGRKSVRIEDVARPEQMGVNNAEGEPQCTAVVDAVESWLGQVTSERSTLAPNTSRRGRASLEGAEPGEPRSESIAVMRPMHSTGGGGHHDSGLGGVDWCESLGFGSHCPS